MSFSSSSSALTQYLWAIFVFSLLLRLLSLAGYPLMDTTEARYGEMARIMVETGNWLTPQFDYGVPFWGKPPLFTWISAAGIELFGLNEFAVRAPHWFAGVLALAVVFFFAKRLQLNPLITVIVLASCAIFGVAAGAVMTDMLLCLGMTLAMLGFYSSYLNLNGQGLRDGYVGFVGLAIGLLAKGPVVIVLVGLAVMPWLMLQHGLFGAWKVLWQRIPLLTGSLLMLGIAAPWYFLAEQATPGFLDYFLVGEHFKRFVESGWTGDLYGSAHDEPRGTIWLFWLMAAMPWSIVLPILLVKRRQQWLVDAPQTTGLYSFLSCWMIAPMLLFTFAGNILPAYVLPGIPALALLIASFVRQQDMKWFIPSSLLLPLLFIVAVALLSQGDADKRSDALFFKIIKPEQPVFYVGKRPFSARFYSQGKAQLLTEAQEKNAQVLHGFSEYYLVGKAEEVQAVVQQQALNCGERLASPSKRRLYLCR